MINIIGAFFGITGYSIHTRNLANALNKLTEVKVSTPLFENWQMQCNDEELKMINKADTKDSINLIIDLPFNWNQYASKKYNIGFLVFEGDKIPVSWLHNIKDERISQIWVPSIHTYEAIKNTNPELFNSIKNKIKIVPHGVDINNFKKLDIKKQFNFLVNKGFRNELDRGGMQHAIKAFIKEFDKGEARMLLKLNPSYAMNPNQLTTIINKYIYESGKSNDKIPEIAVSYDILSPSQMNELYNQCKVLVNPTEGESFGLHCIEALACGLPVITTNFGGQTDFITNKNGWLIDYTLSEVKHEILYEGINWAKPNILQLQRVMREALKEDIIKSKEDLITPNDFTWENSAKKAIEFIKELN